MPAAGGTLTFASVVAPYANTTSALNNTSAFGAARALYAIARMPTGLTGPMAPAIDALKALQGAALSTAVSQTVPALAGAATQATSAAPQAYQRTVRDRPNRFSTAPVGRGIPSPTIAAGPPAAGGGE